MSFSRLILVFGRSPATTRGLAHVIAAVLFLAVTVTTWMAARTLNNANDLAAHVDYWLKSLQTGEVPYLPLFYYTLGTLTGFTRNRDLVVTGLALLLGGSIAFRYLASVRILRGWSDNHLAARTNAALLALAGLAIAVSPPIRWYNHQVLDWIYTNFPTNMWHNSTFVFMMPFAVLLFKAGMDFVESDGKRGMPALAIYSILNVLSKPSFFLCFAPGFLLLAVCRLRGLAVRLRAAAPIAGGSIFLVALYWYIYHYSNNEGGGLALGFFHVWVHYAGDAPCIVIPLAAVNSLLFPTTFFLVYTKFFISDRAIGFATLLFAIGLIIFIVIYETGRREYDGNMRWQLSVCNYLLHVTVVGAFMRIKSADNRWYARDWLLAAVFAVQVLAGTIYLGQFAWTGSP
jgi:hypothetical protein